MSKRADSIAEPAPPPRRATTRARVLAVVVGVIGFPAALWFNSAVLPTDGPGPIGLGAAFLILALLFTPRLEPPQANGSDPAHE